MLFGKEFDDPGATQYSVSPDGKTLLFAAYSPAGKQMIQALSLDGSDNIRSFLQGSFNVTGPHFSPDGRWVAYTTDESGQRQLCVQPFPGVSGKWMISTEGGQYPRGRATAAKYFFSVESK